jgi:hypothetical protein
MLTAFHHARLRPVLMAFLFAGLLSLPLVADACQIVYTGRATAINAKITVLGVTSDILQADIGMSCNGAPAERVVTTVRNSPPLLLQADSVYAATQGIDGVALTEAGLKDVLLDIPGIKITADAV